MWHNRSGLAVVLALGIVAACSSSGDTTGEPSATSDASGDGGSTGSSVVIGSAGGTVEISAGSELAPGARLVVPPRALDHDLTVGLEARTAPSDVFEPDAKTLTALLDYSFTSDASSAMHPTMGPIAIVAAATPVGPEFVLSPDGAEFGAPVSLEIPVGAVPVPDGATLLALLESAGGQVEVIEHIEVGNTDVVVPLSHFSAVKIISIPANVLDVFVFGTDEAAIDDAFDLVGPHVQQVSGEVVTSLCDRRDTVTFDPAGLPGYLGLLDNLARAEGDYIGGIDFDQLYEMGLWMNRIGDEGLPPVSVAEIYDQALTVTGGDAFGALVLAHETLRDDRFTKKYTQYVTDVRGDGPDARGNSTDEVGARYHLLGTAVYGFWYAYQQDHPDAFWSAARTASGAPPIPTAEEAAAFEEAYVSGDISTDPGEFVVDLQGAQLGRQLYEAVRATSDTAATDPCLNRSEPTATTTTTPTTTTTVAPTTTTTTTTVPTITFPITFSGTGTYTFSSDFTVGECVTDANLTVTLLPDGSVEGTIDGSNHTFTFDSSGGTTTLKCLEEHPWATSLIGTHEPGSVKLIATTRPDEVFLQGTYQHDRLTIDEQKVSQVSADVTITYFNDWVFVLEPQTG